MRGHRSWPVAWRDPEPRRNYEVIIVGGGGHGLATAYYLAKTYGIRDIAVLEKGWIGSGNAGRNTTMVRSNYLLPASVRFYEWSLRMWERLESELDFNVMMSQRGVLNLFHTDPQRDAYARRGNAMLLGGADAELLGPGEIARLVPGLDFENARFPIRGGLLQPRGGTARHDAVVWGYARAADRLGVDIIQDCEVLGLEVQGGRIRGAHTSRGFIGANRVGLAVAGNTSRLGAMAGLRLPIESHVLQAFVTEAVKPVLGVVLTYGAGHFYVTQSDKGGVVFGGDIDGYNSYAQRGSLPIAENVCECGMALMPCFGRLRILRNWGGLVDMSMDGSPIIDRTPVESLFLNGGWCYGGFKATPASGAAFAHLIANGEAHPDAASYRLDRFETGHVIDEKGAGAQANLH